MPIKYAILCTQKYGRLCTQKYGIHFTLRKNGTLCIQSMEHCACKIWGSIDYRKCMQTMGRSACKIYERLYIYEYGTKCIQNLRHCIYMIWETVYKIFHILNTV